jgi:branched-chain amino acid transport system ATP-binding protein
VLSAERLTVRYGAVRAATAVDLDVDAGELVALLGANGAGKTSTLAALSGLVPFSGTVTLDGQPVRDPEDARRQGIVHAPEGRGLFARLTVEQNVALGAFGLPRRAQGDAVASARARVPEVDQWWGRRVGTLSGGEQTLVALARLIAARPRYALLDEPALGLAPAAVERLFAEVAVLRSDGVGVVLVEQYAERALELADRVVVLERGAVAYAGDPEGVGGAEVLLAGYLGGPR